mgnify:CR=1 FL=1
MFNIFSTNVNLFLSSALEQFEIITLYYPEFGGLSKLISFFFPKELLNNINLNILIVSIYLFAITDLKINKIYTSNFMINKDDLKLVSVINFLGFYKNLENLVEINKKEDKSLSLEMIFLIFNFVNFVYSQILKNLSYVKQIYLNYALALFMFLLACNLFAMVPYSLTITGYITVTLSLSGMSFFGNLIIALRVHGLKFFKFFLPNGVSGPLLILMVVIETISYIARLFSMAIRLFANMLSGHALIKILSGLVFLTFNDLYLFGVIHILFNLITIAVTALEVIVASLQAYVFVILSVVYTNEAIVLH